MTEFQYSILFALLVAAFSLFVIAGFRFNLLMNRLEKISEDYEAQVYEACDCDEDEE